MTNEEARNILLTSVHPQTAEEAEAIGIAVKAVEKMIPKKPIREQKELVLGGDIVTVLRCPNCDTYIGICDKDNKVDWNKTPFSECCRYCYQAIDWSEEQE